MKYLKYTVLVILFVLSYGSKRINRQKQIPAYYELEIKGLNYRIKNDLSDFEYSKYIDKQVKRFIQRWELKGVSIAVIKDEKLVYAQGFGEADRQGNEVYPGSLFRVASVSKLLTAIAIMQLVEENRLSLSDKVFGPGAILDNSHFERVRDQKLYNITVRNLLAHSGGWSQRYGDPAFHSLSIADIVGDTPPATMDTYSKYVASRRLSFAPGTQVSYSNLGYMFLGEVISAISGKSYEDYVRDEVLIPNGIVDMHIGRSHVEYRYPNEVDYFEQRGSQQIFAYEGTGIKVPKSDGGNPIELLGAAGGWICSSVELARLLVLIDGHEAVRDILQDSSILEMTDNTYAQGPLGWRATTDHGTWARTGSMAGSVAMLKRQNDGLSWIFLSNTSSWKGSRFSSEINRFMGNLTRRVKEWPQQDLFNYYPIETLPLALN
ncbi:serine hydrolase domain-containing protein [uncultured Sunxiuqinia sp.]|uniref:serine hydrolase domain-containing protein n=1 Tax=uncultured Sunxiuqinia sp. TaxID=1573825 RepID=UPI00262C2501|nr:serine hydrolase domain-containing protein [uncultured Sunxiuqinia sp.]